MVSLLNVASTVLAPGEQLEDTLSCIFRKYLNCCSAQSTRRKIHEIEQIRRHIFGTVSQRCCIAGDSDTFECL